MKIKLFAFLLAVVMIVSCSAVIFAAEDDLEILPAGGYKIGDVNRDKEINVKDATLVQKVVAMLEKLSFEQLPLADNDFDGQVTIKDATYIQKVVAGLEPPAAMPMRPTAATETEETPAEETTAVQITTQQVVTTAAETTVVTDPEESTETENKTDATEAPVTTVQPTDPTEPPVVTTSVPEPTATDPVETTVEPTTRDKNKPIELPFVPAK